MSKVKSSIKSKRIFFGTGKLISLFYCAFAMLFFPYLKWLEIPFYIVIIITFLAFSVSIAVMPLIYDLINSSSIIAAGRYHLPLAISSVGLAFFTVLFFTASQSHNYESTVIRLFFSMMFASLFIMIFRYVYQSISTRLFGAKDKKINLIGNIFTGLGVTIFILCFMFMYDGSFERISQISYIVGIVIVLIGFSVYMSSYLDMPRFIRIEKPHKLKIKIKYQKFFGALSNKENIRDMISYLLSCVSLAIFALQIVVVGETFISSHIIIASSMLVFAVFLVFTIYFFSKFVKKNITKAMVLAIVIQIMALATIIVRCFITFGANYDILVFFGISAFLGIGGGIQLTGGKKGYDDVLGRSNLTRGIISTLYNMMITVAVAISVAVIGLSSISNEYSLVIAISISAAFAIASIVVNLVLENKKLELNLEGTNVEIL